MGHRPHPFRRAQQNGARELVVLSELARGTLHEYDGAQR